jgi:hypothetical protein
MVGSMEEGGCFGEEMFLLRSELLQYEMVFREEGCFEKRTMPSRKNVLERT